jgi:hypothetical protein
MTEMSAGSREGGAHDCAQDGPSVRTVCLVMELPGHPALLLDTDPPMGPPQSARGHPRQQGCPCLPEGTVSARALCAFSNPMSEKVRKSP